MLLSIAKNRLFNHYKNVDFIWMMYLTNLEKYIKIATCLSILLANI